MKTYCKLVHSMPARLIQLFGGLWLVIFGAPMSPGYAVTLALVGTAIAVTGIADICPIELVIRGTQPKSSGSQERVA